MRRVLKCSPRGVIVIIVGGKLNLHKVGGNKSQSLIYSVGQLLGEKLRVKRIYLIPTDHFDCSI